MGSRDPEAVLPQPQRSCEDSAPNNSLARRRKLSLHLRAALGGTFVGRSLGPDHLTRRGDGGLSFGDTPRSAQGGTAVRLAAGESAGSPFLAFPGPRARARGPSPPVPRVGSGERRGRGRGGRRGRGRGGRRCTCCAARSSSPSSAVSAALRFELQEACGLRPPCCAGRRAGEAPGGVRSGDAAPAPRAKRRGRWPRRVGAVAAAVPHRLPLCLPSRAGPAGSRAPSGTRRRRAWREAGPEGRCPLSASRCRRGAGPQR